MRSNAAASCTVQPHQLDLYVAITASRSIGNGSANKILESDNFVIRKLRSLTLSTCLDYKKI